VTSAPFFGVSFEVLFEERVEEVVSKNVRETGKQTLIVTVNGVK